MKYFDLSFRMTNLVFGLFVLVALGGCSGGGGGGAPLAASPTATLTSIAITPAAVTIASGASIQLTATGTYSDGSTADITSSVVWNSSAPATASVADAGVVMGVAIGDVAITATLDGITSAAANITVSTATLGSIVITPAAASIAQGTTSAFTATGTFSDGTSSDLSGSVTWTSANPSTASVTSPGVVTGNGVGTTTLTASLQGITSSPVDITVTTATLKGIAITPATTSLAKGTTTTLSATGTFSDGSTGNVSGSVTWTSANPNTASVTSPGVVTGNAVGTTTVRAALNGVTSSPAAITVTAATLGTIAITPTSATISLGGTTTLNATATYSDGTTADVSNQVSWSSTATNIASVGSLGVVTGVAAGSATITATLSGITSSAANVTVNGITLNSIAITPSSTTIAAGSTTTFTATGSYSNGTTGNVSGSVTWQSSDTTVATINASGIATAVGGGSTTITASLNGVTSNGAILSVPLDLWTTQAPLQYPRDNDANAVLNGRVYVFGGAPAGTSVLSSMEVYDPVLNTWPLYDLVTFTLWPTMPAPRYGLTATPFNGVIYLIGGTSKVNGQNPIYPIVVYDPNTNSFSSTVPGTSTPLAELPTGRWGFHTAVVDGQIYAIGGAVYVPGGITPVEWDSKITGATSGAAITPLTNDKPYYFVVTAVDANGQESAASPAVSATPQASYAMGAVPSGLSTVTGNGEATLNWVGVSGASSYNIYYGLKSNDALSNMTKVPVAASSATLTGLANGTTYYLVVTALVNGVETLPSTEVAVSPQIAPDIYTPAGVTLTAGNGQATLSWSPVPNAVSYNVYYGTGHNIYYGTVEAYDPVANTWTTKATMPTPRRGMSIAVVNGRIYAMGGWGGWPELSVNEVYDPATNTWTTTVPINTATIAAGSAGKPLAPMPTARDDFGYAVLNGNIYTIGGDINTFDAVLGIPCCTTVTEVYDPVANTWSTVSPMPTMRDDFDASMVDGVIYAIAGSRDGVFLTPGLPNEGGYSLTVNEAYRTSNIPLPRGVAATSGANQVSLSWNAVDGASSYNIYWSNKAGVATSANSTKITNVSSPYLHSGLTAGKWYYYVVTAVTASGESLPSNEVAIKP